MIASKLKLILEYFPSDTQIYGEHDMIYFVTENPISEHNHETLAFLDIRATDDPRVWETFA